jgi:4-cresol dehydrogenase (hydroxylating)
MVDVVPYVLDPAVADRLIAVVGEDAALRSEAERDEYRDPFWHQDDRTYDSSLVLFPTTLEDLQEIVAIANSEGVPLWTSSQGRNNGYGGPSSRLPGSVLVSLRRMNRVLEIDRELAYAVVEPGVSWFDLREALDASGNEDLWFAIPDLGWGSVIGNSLDNGVTYAPYGQDFQKLCGLEVLLATGEIVRTGFGAQPDNDAWHVYPRGFGPVLDQMFLQSNLGIVTKAGIWLMRRPEAFAPLFLSIPTDALLPVAIDLVREWRLDGIARGVPTIQNLVTMVAQFDHTRHLYLRADPTTSQERLDELALETGLGRWGLRVGAWGDGPIVAHQVARMKRDWAQHIPGGTVVSESLYGRDEWDSIERFSEKVQAGIPSLDIIQATPANIGHLAFSPVLPTRGAYVAEQAKLIGETIAREIGLNHVCAIFFPNERSTIIVNSITFNVDDEPTFRRAYDTVRTLIEEGGRRGYTEYRAHIDLMDLISDQLSEGDYAYRRFVERLKDTLDPNGILAPGKYGVWPSGYRA